MKVSDYVISYLEKIGIKDIFIISGGGNMHLVDSVGRNKNIRYICNHHEQASAMAVEGYARFKNDMGAAIVTTGPGGTNAITGVAGCWLDSIPAIIISGQVKLEDTIYINNVGVRQFGDQEINIIDIVKPITKYAAMVTDKNYIRYHLEKATYLAKSGRPGPVWIDIPLDIQGSIVSEEELIPFTPPISNENPMLKEQVRQVIDLLCCAKRPLLIAGNGTRLSGACDDLLQLVEILQIPTVSSINGKDLITEEYPYFIGTPGIAGQRGANFAMQNCDLLISIGSRLMLRHIGFNYKHFAREARKIVIDIDHTELAKKSINPCMPICADAGEFIRELIRQLGNNKDLKTSYGEWKQKCLLWRQKYNTIEDYHLQQKEYVNSYYFMQEISKRFTDKHHIVTSNGTAYISTLQAVRAQRGQRLIFNKALASMGYGLPAAIGACVANGRKEILCFENDGSLQMNIQELQTVVHYNLPIKMIVFNNRGYLSIKITQSNFFPDNITACDPSTGVSCPDLEKISYAYGIPFIRIHTTDEVDGKLVEFFTCEGPIVCEVMMDPWQPMLPKTSSVKTADGRMLSKPLEDMYPFLPREEFMENMIIKPVDEGVQ